MLAHPAPDPGEEADAASTLAAQEALVLWELSSDLLATASPAGYLTRVNPSWERTLGRSAEELMSRPYLDFVHPDDVADTAREAQALTRPGHRTVNFDNRYQAADGSYRWLSWSARPSDDGATFYCVVRDVTQAHEAADEYQALVARLEERELMLSAVIRNTVALIYVKALDGRYLLYNQPFVDAFHLEDRGRAEGTTGLEVLLGRDDTWLDREHAAQWQANDARAARGPLRLVEWYDDPVLGRRSYDSWKFPLEDVSGRVYAICGVALETTEHDRLIEQHRQAEELFRGAFEHSPMGKALVAADHRIMRANAALARITGYSVDELAGRTWQDLTALEDAAGAEASLDDLAAGRIDTWEHEVRLTHVFGDPVWVQSSWSALRVEDRLNHFIVQVQDVTQRKMFEEQLRHVADHDWLTGLHNRRVFEEDLRVLIGRCQRYGEEAALLLIDLDGFKAINDEHGHQVGDDLLRAVADSVSRRLRSSDRFARLGGDEFAILLEHADGGKALTTAEAVRTCVAGVAVVVAGIPVHVRASVGIALIDRETSDPSAVLAQADSAMYAAKQRGRGGPRQPGQSARQPTRDLHS